MAETAGNMFAEERRQKIVEMVNTRRKVTVPELCTVFDVSPATVRNDLRDLQKVGQLLRTHGGAMVGSKTGMELESAHREVQHLAEKTAIAQTALSLIEDGDTIVLDTGTTTFELARLLSQKKGIKVVTNDIRVAAHLEKLPDLDVILLGGILRRGFHCTINSRPDSMVTSLTVDKAFMGANAFSFEKGAATPDIQHAETKKLMISISNKVVVLCDSSKIGSASFAQFANLDQIDTLVTDAMSPEDSARFEDGGVEVLTGLTNDSHSRS